MVYSTLEKIEGIGEVKAKKLLSHFKSIKAISAASEEQLKAVKGITQKDVDNIINYFKAR